MAEAALDLSIGTQESTKDVQIQIGKNTKRVAIQIEKSTTPYEEYQGPYDVTPTFFYGTTLETVQKVMIQDVTVQPIPVSSVSNPAGGRTVTIG